MIRKEELMLGDWVQTDLGEIQQVAELRQDGIMLAYNDIYAGDELDGVPLTPEILEKNGFGKLVTYGTEKWLSNNVRLNVYDSEGTWRFCADTNRNEHSVIYIRFVHQLQHALRLCGIEKTIEI